MSGTSYDSICPKCNGENLMCSSDYKPFDCVSGECLDCGFTYWTQDGQLTLEEVNESRKGFELEPLKELNKQEEL